MPSAPSIADLAAGLEVDREDLVADDARELLVLDREEDLDAAAQVARHEVGAADDEAVLAAAVEPVDAAVLEVAADDAADADVLGEPGHAGPQAADPADDQVDLARPRATPRRAPR